MVNLTFSISFLLEFIVVCLSFIIYILNLDKIIKENWVEKLLINHLIKMEKEKIGIYIRVSTLKQKTDGSSLSFQKEDGIKFCLENDYDFEIFDEGNISGKDYEREEWLKLENKILNKEISGIYIWDFNRVIRGFDIEYHFYNNFRKKII